MENCLVYPSVHLRLPVAGQIYVPKSLVHPCTLNRSKQTRQLQSLLFGDECFKVRQFNVISERLRVDRAFELTIPLMPL